MMRRGGRGLVRGMAATAVVAGTAGAVRHHQDQKWANQAADQQAQEQAQSQAAYDQAVAAQAAAAQNAAPPAAAAPDLNQQLQKLAELHNSGILTDEEFAAAKAKVLQGI
jgi:transcription initiation factor TFIID subunit TAF12